MKKILYVILLICIGTLGVNAQVNPGWQGVLRGATNNKPVINTNVSVRFTILEQGKVLYMERHSAKTSPFGLINLQICGGTRLQGDCKKVGSNPAGGAPVLKVEIDPKGGSNFIDFGTAPLNQAFVAAYALEVMKDKVNDADTDPNNELQKISLSGDNELTLSQQGGKVTLDADTSNEFQTLSLDANTRMISLSNGNAVMVPPRGSDKDGSSSNEIQSIRLINGKITLLPDGGEVEDRKDDADADPENELQFITLSGTKMTIANGNTLDLKSIKLPSDIIWKADNAKGIVYWDDPSKSRHIQFGEGGFQYGEGNGIRVTNFGENVAEDYFKWTTPKFPANSYFKSGLLMMGKPDWYYESYWQIDEDKLLTIALTHPQRKNSNGFATSRMVFGSARKGSYIPNLLIQGAGTGAVYLLNPQDPTQAIAGLDVDPMTNKTRIFAQTKNFKENDPSHVGKDIWYTSIEGPEVGMYDRGTATLHSGEAFVPFKEHFASMAVEGTYTVILSPLSASSKGLAVVRKGKDGFYVKELFDGTGNYKFEWHVKAVRKGFEHFEVVRKKQQTNIEYLKQRQLTLDK